MYILFYLGTTKINSWWVGSPWKEDEQGAKGNRRDHQKEHWPAEKLGGYDVQKSQHGNGLHQKVWGIIKPKQGQIQKGDIEANTRLSMLSNDSMPDWYALT